MGIGGKCEGGSQEEMVKAANFIILAVPPTALKSFIDTYSKDLKGKMFVDLSVTFSRFGSTRVQPPASPDGPNWNGPYFDMVNYLRDRLGGGSSSWVKAWHNLAAASIYHNRVQPVEVAGDDAAKAVAFKMMELEGWEPLDCGSVEDIPKIETGFH